jgi:NAD(P)H-flavin reductase/ferredoxin
MAPTITLDGRAIGIGDGESVLDALERHALPALSSCRTGVCQTCLMQALEGPVPARAQQGLKDSLRAQGYFLACVCHPSEDMVIAPPGAGLEFETEVLSSDDLGAAVRSIRLAAPPSLEWFAGQYLTLIRCDGIARSYSVASGPTDGFLELHVRRLPGGALSNWLHDDVRPGETVRFRGMFGDCFYAPGDPDTPLLLAGTGTGLAPLYGILFEALRQGHVGPIHLFHGAVDSSGLYLRDELGQLASRGSIDYRPCVLRGDAAEGLCVGSLDDIVLGHPLDTKATRAYLCGDPALVEKMRKKLFLKGLSSRRIFADAFVPSAPRS